MEHLLTIVLKI